MPLMSIRELIALSGSERQHLHSVEEALRDVLLSHAMAARANDLDADVITNATITLLLAFAAREAVDLAWTIKAEIESHHFANLASEAMAWGQKRSDDAPDILH